MREEPTKKREETWRKRKTDSAQARRDSRSAEESATVEREGVTKIRPKEGIQCERGHEIEAVDVHKREAYCSECAAQIRRGKRQWMCEKRCVMLCERCTQKRIEKKIKKDDPVEEWINRTTLKISETENINTRARQQCNFDFKMAKYLSLIHI